MCGLVACIAKTKNGFNQFDLDAFGEMLFGDTLRGKDSTGVFGINNLGNVGIVKDAGTAEKFLGTDEYKNLERELFREGWAIVGHNRKATRGEVNDVNAHPFWVEDKLTLVHNGSYVGSHKQLADVEVDSHAIAIHLSENLNDIEKALQKVNAAYALIFYDIENKQLHFIRNKERPLFKVETNSAIFFASEPGLLYWILHRNNIKPTGKIEPLEEHTLYSWKLNSENHAVEETVKKLDCSFRYQYSGNHTHNSPAYENWRHEWEDECDPCGYTHWHRQRQGQNYPTQQQQPAQVHNLTHYQTNKPPHVATPKAANNPRAEFDVVRDLCIPSTTHPHFKHAEWEDLKKERYAPGKRINVIVNDWTQPKDDKDEFFLTATTLDPKAIPVVFHVDGSEVEKLVEADCTDDGFLFEIEIDSLIWKRSQPIGAEAPKSTAQLDTLEGVAFVIGKNHKMVVQGTTNGQTH